MEDGKEDDSWKEDLEREFCPPLDSSLFYGLVNDVEYSPEAMVELRNTLSTLAVHAIPDTEVSTNAGLEDNSDSLLQSANTSVSLDSPVLFLQTAFPGLSVQALQEALENGTDQTSGLNMEKIVEDLLSAELLESLEDDASFGSPTPSGSQRSTPKQKASKNKQRAERLIIGDVLQRQMAVGSKQNVSSKDQVDPWTQLSSIAEFLSSLTGAPSSAFLSAFHSPENPTAFHAVAGWLESLPPSKLSEDKVDIRLAQMAEIMTEGHDDEELDAQWARKCIYATRGHVSEAIEMYNLLQSLEELGPINHLPAPAQLPLTTSSSHAPRSTAPRSVPTIPEAKGRHTKPPPRKIPNNDWQVVKKKAPKAFQHPSHADYIPAYRKLKAVPAWTVKNESDEVMQHRNAERSWQERRIEALRKASQHWQRGQDGYGGAVASYYADEANKYLRESRVAAIEAARALVVRNRAHNKANGYYTQNSVDLHGMRREEALVIVKEVLAARQALRNSTWVRISGLEMALKWSKAAQQQEPVRFITGKGNHSAGNQSVLLPALKAALKVDGWNFREVEAAVIVYGKH